MNYGEIKTTDIANGIGVRVSLFVSGCTHHCKGCFNEQTWDFNFGKPYTKETEEAILSALAPNYIEGLTLLGGEPFEPQNQAVLAPLLERIKSTYPEKTVWCYSGYDFEKHILPCRIGDPSVTKRMIASIDVLVDGRFVEEKKDLSLRFRGSSNQRIIDVRASLENGEVVLMTEFY